MPADEDEYFSYFLVKKDEKDMSPSFAFGGRKYVDDVKAKWLAKAAGATDDGGTEDEASLELDASDQEDFTHHSALSEALTASVDFGLAQNELIEAGLIAPVFIRLSLLNSYVIGPIQGRSTEIECDESISLHGLSESDYAELIKREEKYTLSKRGTERFPAAILLSLVATFDTLIVEILAKMLRLQTDWLEKSDRSICISRIAHAQSLEELIGEQISEELYQFSRGSHTDQAKYIRSNFGIDIQKNWKRWPDYIEIFERRNLVAHGERFFNKRYVSICAGAGHKGSDSLLGEEVMLTESYLFQTLNVLIEFAVLLSFMLYRKFVEGSEEQAFNNLNQAVFKLNQRGHHLVAERLSAFALSLTNTKVTEETRLMLIVNEATALRLRGEDSAAKHKLGKQDWSAASDLFKFCVAAVEGEVQDFIKLIPALKSSGAVTAHSILTWPCFSFMIEEEEVQKELQNHFQIDTEKLKKKKKDDASVGEDDVSVSSDENDGDEPLDTVH